MKILLIDDESAIRDLLELRISMDLDDVQVIHADDGDDALQTCRDVRPDALVVDGHMPGASGDALGIGLRALVPNAKIVSFTGSPGSVEWADVQVVKATHDDLTKVLEALDDHCAVRLDS